MNYDIFESDKEKQDAKKALPELGKHPGWKFIVKALDINILHFTEQLKTRKDFGSLDELYALQDRIDDLTNFKDLPKFILTENPDEPEEEDDSIY
jgi:hypothetical protein